MSYHNVFIVKNYKYFRYLIGVSESIELIFFTESKLKRKWKYLRDQFSIELTKSNRSKSGDAATKTEESKWPHLKLLLFLRDIVKPRLSTGNIIPETETTGDVVTIEFFGTQDSAIDVEEVTDFTIEDPNNDELHTDVLDNCDEIYSENLENTESISPRADTANTYSTAKKRAKRPLKEYIIDIEREKLKILRDKMKIRESSEKNEDEDLHFLKSLLPHIKKIPDNRKLTFRSKIQEVVERFAYPSTSYHVPSPYSTETSFSNPDSVHTETICYVPQDTMSTLQQL